MREVFFGIIIPFIGTSLGAACVFLLAHEPGERVREVLSGLSAGVMTAASVWSLLLPSIADSERLGALAFLPAAVGFVLGALFICVIGKVAPTLSRRGSAGMTAFAVTLHNIPEGMAVGVAYAGFLMHGTELSLMGAFSLALGIAIQNFPEGAIVSMPLRERGRGRAFLVGTLSGIVEPIAAALPLLALAFVAPLMPYLLSFAAGAMMCVVVEELIPDLRSAVGTLSFTLGFVLMMALDVALG